MSQHQHRRSLHMMEKTTKRFVESALVNWTTSVDAKMKGQSQTSRQEQTNEISEGVDMFVTR
eukprot:7477060-Prorocentrum_lima.AAC.1